MRFPDCGKFPDLFHSPKLEILRIGNLGKESGEGVGGVLPDCLAKFANSQKFNFGRVKQVCEFPRIWESHGTHYIMYNSAQGQYLSQIEEGGPIHVEGACSRISSKDIVSTIKTVEFTCTEIVSTLGIPKKNSKVMTLKTPFTKEQLQEAQQAILDRCVDDSE
jgi:hypothetical protein